MQYTALIDSGSAVNLASQSVLEQLGLAIIAPSNYVQRFAARAVLGIGEASYYPAGTALLGDYFRKEGRARAMSVWAAGSGGG